MVDVFDQEFRASYNDAMDGRLLVLGLLLVFAGLYAGVYFLASGITPLG
jgi:hypothetical protein